ncbi:MAG: hypothetical protein NVSMB34_14660 [Variovorax sp.]
MPVCCRLDRTAESQAVVSPGIRASPKHYIVVRQMPSLGDAAVGNPCVMHTTHPRSRPHSLWHLAALVYTCAGVVGVIASATLPANEAAMLIAIAGGLPWSLSLLTLDLTSGVAQTAVLLLAGSWAVNAALVWWLALRRAAAQRGR